MSILNYQQSHLDCSKIESINKGQLCDLINNFTITYLDKLKKLMANVDLQLYNLNSKIIACHSNLCILESRIASVPGLEDIKLNDDKNSNVRDERHQMEQTDQVDQADQTEQTDSKQIINKEESIDDQQTKSNENETNKTDELNQELNQELAKYKRMLSVGVPLAAVQIKMRTEGFDPNLLK